MKRIAQKRHNGRRLGQVLSRQSDALLLLTATPHDGYDRSLASLLELLDPSLVDGSGHVREDAYHSHIVRRLKKHVKVIHPLTGEYVSFPERQLIPVEVVQDSALHPQYVALHPVSAAVRCASFEASAAN